VRIWLEFGVYSVGLGYRQWFLELFAVYAPFRLGVLEDIKEYRAKPGTAENPHKYWGYSLFGRQILRSNPTFISVKPHIHFGQTPQLSDLSFPVLKRLKVVALIEELIHAQSDQKRESIGILMLLHQFILSCIL